MSAVRSSEKSIIISLRGLTHEACVAATQPSYWQQVSDLPTIMECHTMHLFQLVKGSSITISCEGVYVPVQMESMSTDDEEPRLHLQIKSRHELDRKQLDSIQNRL